MPHPFPAPRLIISGLSGGGGKTLVSLGLSRALTLRGLQVKPCKKGPDYIDAAWLGLACGRTPTNLDPYFLNDDRLRALFCASFGNADLAVIEGNRGLYDGRDVQGSCSTATLARALDAPVVLVLSVTKMTRTAAAVIAGVAAFEPLNLAGVVLNRVASVRHAELIRKSIETYTGIPVLGMLPRLEDNPIPERHMGLISLHEETEEAPGRHVLNEALDRLAGFVAEHMDIDKVLNIARNAPDMPPVAPFWDPAPPTAERPVRIGYVRDAALWFYYEENLEALRRAGAELVELSLLSPEPWPGIDGDGALDGLYLGGGFPEMVPHRIAASPHLATIRNASLCGMPIYAECGGFMILCDALRIDDQNHRMAGLFPSRADFCPRPQGLGYVEATVERENPFHPVGEILRGHEFHYSRCVPLGELTPTLRLSPGVGMSGPGHRAKGLAGDALSARDGLLVRNTFAAYTHLFAPAVPHWAPRFVKAAEAFRSRRAKGHSPCGTVTEKQE